jgi:hypothetical protein
VFQKPDGEKKRKWVVEEEEKAGPWLTTRAGDSDTGEAGAVWAAKRRIAQGSRASVRRARGEWTDGLAIEVGYRHAAGGS